MDPIHELANAIVERAAKDYRKALKDLHKNPQYEDALETKKECEEFFLSGWFGVLTNLNGEVLMEDICRMVKAEVAV